MEVAWHNEEFKENVFSINGGGRKQMT